MTGPAPWLPGPAFFAEASREKMAFAKIGA